MRLIWLLLAAALLLAQQRAPQERWNQHRVSNKKSPAPEPGAENEMVPSLVEGLKTPQDWWKKKRPEMMRLWMTILGKTEPAPTDRKWFGDIRQARILNTVEKEHYTRIEMELPIERDFFQSHLLFSPKPRKGKTPRRHLLDLYHA